MLFSDKLKHAVWMNQLAWMPLILFLKLKWKKKKFISNNNNKSFVSMGKKKNSTLPETILNWTNDISNRNVFHIETYVNTPLDVISFSCYGCATWPLEAILFYLLLQKNPSEPPIHLLLPHCFYRKTQIVGSWKQEHCPWPSLSENLHYMLLQRPQ